MNYPERVVFKCIGNNSKKPIANIAISLIIYAHKKNDYYVGPKITDTNGLVTFDKDECIKEIESSRKFYLMDYLSTLEECLPKVAIKIKPREEIIFAVKNMRQLKDIYQNYWNCSEAYLSSLELTNNAKYVSRIYEFSESYLWQNKTLEIMVESASELK